MKRFKSIADLLKADSIPFLFEMDPNDMMYEFHFSFKGNVIRRRPCHPSRRFSRPSAVVLNLKGQRGLLMNADDNANDFVEAADREENVDCALASASFSCIARLLFPNLKQGIVVPKKIIIDAMKKVANGEVSILDFRPDSRIPMSKADQRRKNPIPPSPGYTDIGRAWHRPGSVLFRSGKTCYFVGQDDSQYFGVQLQGQVETVEGALLDLQPNSVRGKKWLRQGEWFVLPIADRNMPKNLTPDVRLDDGFVALPKTDPKSNTHSLWAEQYRFGLKGEIYAKEVRLSHEEHIRIEADGWCSLVRNTAVRSVSEQGVD